MESSGFRRGQTFAAAYALTVVIDDLPVPDLTGFTGAARLKPQIGASLPLTFVWVDAAHGLAGLSAGPTGGWPLGVALIEVQLTSPSGVKIDLPPVEFPVIRGFADE